MLFELSGMPLLRQDTFFRLPTLPLEVAPECSGIHSTVVLFITSLVAGYVCLRSPWRRALLTLIVIPLALLRNGLRIFTIGELCVNIGPEMLDSYIHRRGGPIFFALSLIPFFLILLLLWKSERKGPPTDPDSALRPQTASL
jgi:exosortase/archaeosortase family protein